MAHSHMDHGDMDHGDHSGHDMPMPMCNMNMLFTWNTENLCIVFESWRVTDFWSLIISLFAIIVLTAGYEAVRDASRRYEQKQAVMLETMPRKYFDLCVGLLKRFLALRLIRCVISCR